MLSESQVDDLYDNMKTPYSQEEFGLFIRDPGSRTRKVLEHVHYHNMELCVFVEDWLRFRQGVGLKPSDSLVLRLTPGNEGVNDARRSLAALVEYYSNFPHGSLPRWPILAYMSRTSFTLMETIASLHPTDHLTTAKGHFNDFINLLRYKGEPRLMRDEFARRLHDAATHFLDECELNAIELEMWIRKLLSGDTSEEPHSMRRDLIRQKAVERMEELYASGMTWSEAEEKTQSEMWRDFNALGLACAKMNFHKLRYRK